MEKEISDIKPLEKITSVFLVVANSLGEVIGVWGGDNSLLPPILKHYSSIAYPKDSPAILVTKKEDTLTALGQDIYQVDRDFVLGTKLALTFIPLDELNVLEKKLSLAAKFSLVVSY